jgi:hypothetical protein
MAARRLELSVLPERFAVCRLGLSSPLPAWLPDKGFVCVTRTADELSIVCDQACVPSSVKSQRGRAILSVHGPVEFSEVGVLAALAVPVADAGISIFVVSTFDTDHLIVAEEDLGRTIAALTAAGHKIHRTSGR